MALSQNALCTLADLKGELGIAGSSEDTYLERLIESITNAAERYCGRPEGFHYEAARVDDMPGFGTPIIHLPKTPVISVASVVWDPDDANTTLDATEYRIDNTDQGRLWRDGGWDWTAIRAQNIVSTPLPGTEEHLYRVTYAAGWVTQNQDDLDGALTRNLPYDLEDACIQLCTARYRRKGRDPFIKSEKVLGSSVSYGAGVIGPESSSGIPNHIRAVFDGYRRVSFG